MIAFLRAEPGAEMVRSALEEVDSLVFAHATNLCEIYYDFARASNDESANLAIAALESAGVRERQDMEPGFWQAAGRLKAKHRRVSLADCYCLALAQRLGGVVLTADRHELEPLANLAAHNIRFIR